MRKFFYSAIIIFGVGASLVSAPVFAAMSSASYVITADGFTLGGVETTSTSYGLMGSLGSPQPNITTSTSYVVRGGFLASNDGALTLALNTTSLSLGTLSSGSVASGSVVSTINTNADSGYTLSIGSVSGSAITGVSDGSVTAGFEEYGVAVAGGNRAFTTDQAIAANLILASYAGPVTNDQITITAKASISGSSAAGSYSQTITLSLAANF